ncbi:MAG: hypothetical protein KC543_11625, partial [Myxococcales bacterium]|nr:hypothetical protein [Myxococcales bacterium]
EAGRFDPPHGTVPLKGPPARYSVEPADWLAAVRAKEAAEPGAAGADDGARAEPSQRTRDLRAGSAEESDAPASSKDDPGTRS